MLARNAGASLGLLSLIPIVTTGQIARHPVTIPPSRGTFIALFLFALFGLVFDRNACEVVAEDETKGNTEIRKRYHEMKAHPPATDGSTAPSAERAEPWQRGVRPHQAGGRPT